MTADGAEPYRPDKGPLPLNERLIQTIWAQQLISPTGLRTADGAPLRVLDAGRWNGSAGPDFKDASLMIGAETVRGDVEIHTKASDWRNHGHQRDLDYNGVALHVVLQIDDDQIRDTLHNGNQLARLEIEPYIFPDLETLRRSLTADDFQYAQPEGVGRCHGLMTQLDVGLIADFLDRAGDERLIGKMQRLDEQAQATDLEQVFFQAMTMALGAGPSKTLYYLLAKRTPLAEMGDYVRELDSADWPTGFEALLIHMAGLAPTDEQLTKAPPEAVARAERLAELWQRWEPVWADRAIEPTRRWFQGLRPVNFPLRRLAGVAVLLAHMMRVDRAPLADLIGHIEAGRASLEGAVPRRKRHPLLMDLVGWFRVEGKGHFWGTHYSFAAKPAGRTMDLIGEGAATSLVLNALLPAALLSARRIENEAQTEAVQRLYGLVPPLQPNHVTEFMTRRLFGDSERGKTLINTERRRQGLFQIFHHCCNAQERHCGECYFLNPTQ